MPTRILIVDDAVFIRDTMKKNLRSQLKGVEILDAVDGNRAVAALKANPIDLILSDWEMPDMSGEELLRWVRQDEKYKKCPFVMVSSRGDRDHIVKAIESGVSDYLTKPFTPEELVKKTIKQLKKIGKEFEFKTSGITGKNQGHAFGSIDALTGGGTAAKTAGKTKVAPIANGMNEALLVKKNGTSNKTTKKSQAYSTAQIRFPNSTCECIVKDMSLQAMVVIIKREASLPTVFDQAVIDIEMGTNDVARINAFVHTIQASGNNASAEGLKVTVRFVDNDPKKMETLSKFIAKQ